jgi:hypothetical protein
VLITCIFFFSLFEIVQFACLLLQGYFTEFCLGTGTWWGDLLLFPRQGSRSALSSILKRFCHGKGFAIKSVDVPTASRLSAAVEHSQESWEGEHDRLFRKEASKQRGVDG